VTTVARRFIQYDFVIGMKVAKGKSVKYEEQTIWEMLIK
jgi:hypothetical protein